MNKQIKKDARKAANGVTGNGSTPVNNLSLAPSIGGGAPTLNLGGTDLSGIAAVSPIFQATQADGPTADEIFAQKQAMQQATLDEYKRRYDWLMSTPNDQLKATEGISIAPDNGSIFQQGVAFLSITAIQDIENKAGNPGALLLKLNQPALAKDTAGYQGGASQTWYESQGVTQPEDTHQAADPIPEVQTLPPVTAITDTSGNVQTVFTDTGTTTLPAGTTATPTGVQQQNALSMPGGKYWWLWYLIAAIAIIIYMKYGRK